MPSIAIIGAGISGLSAAHALLDAGHAVTLFERSSEVGGRATTRRRAGFVYDDGAQYIKQGHAVSISLITERFYTPDLINIRKPVWIFDAQGHVQEGDPVQNAEPRWTYRNGVITLPQLMAGGLSTHFETPIVRVQKVTTGWQLFTDGNRAVGSYDLLLITIPAPQALELIASSELDDDLQQPIHVQLARSRYNQLLSVSLGYSTHLQVRPYYALVNTDKRHAISWVAWEHEKTSERVPAGGSMLIVQMAPDYSKEHQDDSTDSLIQDVAKRTALLLAEELPTPDFTAIQRWRYALPAEKADADTLNALTGPHGLAFCGDAFVGGRVHLALEHGLQVAHQLIQGWS